jgi:hypothetical protein
MNSFLTELREVFKKIPTKTRFLKELGLGNCYTGFTYFIQERKDKPAPKLMKLLTEKIDYEYVLLPVKNTEEHKQLRKKLEDDFIVDVEQYLEKFKNDKGRTYLKDFGDESASAKALKAFEEDDSLDDSEKINIEDLF